MAFGFKAEIINFFNSKGWTLNKEADYTLIFINGDRYITILYKQLK